jgi:hypothetical protein
VPTLRSPLSGREVVGYQVSIEGERGVTAWERVVDVCRVADFELEDESGRVLIRAATSDIELDGRVARGRGGPFRAIPRRVVQLLHRHDRPVEGVLFARAFRWREQVLEEGQSIRVRGWVGEVESTSAGTSDPVESYRYLSRRFAVIGAGGSSLQLLADD